LQTILSLSVVMFTLTFIHLMFTLTFIHCFINCMFLFNVDTTIPVINVQPGEPATFTCALLDQAFTSQTVQWFKQSVGDTMKFIVLVEKNIEPQYSPDFPESRIAVHIDEKFCKLTILRTNPEDEGMYHCGINSFIMNTWSGTYLLLKGKYGTFSQ
uniref:Ig-like domain-containing protein n=1 Tax=Sphaeramia orbicularis TaxID=375764 RepID=A0A672ZR09_9TELE